MVSWWIFGLGVFGGGVVGYFVGRKIKKGNNGSRITRMNADVELEWNEKKVYDVLVKGDGVGFFTKIVDKVGISRKELDEVVKGLKKKGIVREKRFSYQRKFYLEGFLRKRDRRVLEFVSKEGGEADFSLIMDKLGFDDDMLIGIGKKLVRMGLILKIGRGYRTYFVLREK